MRTAVDTSMKEAVQNGVFPSAELLIARGGEIVHHNYYGDARSGTAYDIASLTKPVATATLIMMLYGEGTISPEQTLDHWFKDRVPEANRGITIEMLMNHISGMPAWRPYYRELPSALVGTDEGKEFILSECLNEPREHEAGTTIYSDLGYIVLGSIIERASGSSLDELFEQRIAGPLGLKNTLFVRNGPEMIRTTSRRTDTTAGQHFPTAAAPHPKERPPFRKRFAATEDCHWRSRVIHGEVHDQNAYAMGGVAGHAGLFSDARDLHGFILSFMKGFTAEGLIPLTTLKRFFPLEDGLITPAMRGTFVGGWDTPSAKNSAAGHYSSLHSIGHLAYTGCSLWIDQEQDFWMILLSNRIHPSTTNEKIKAFRPHIHDLVYRELLS